MSKGSHKAIMLLVHLALLIAIEIVLSRFCSISTPLLKIGFAFVPLAICGMLYGPVWAGVAGGVADFLGAVLFPIGPYFPGITVSTILTGVVFGLFLHQDQVNWKHIAAAEAVNCLVVSLCVTTFWLHILYGTPYHVLFVTRIVQNLIMLPIQFAVLRLLQKPVVLYCRRTGLAI